KDRRVEGGSDRKSVGIFEIADSPPRPRRSRPTQNARRGEATWGRGSRPRPMQRPGTSLVRLLLRWPLSSQQMFLRGLSAASFPNACHFLDFYRLLLLLATFRSYSTLPNNLISSISRSDSGRGVSPRASFSLWTWRRTLSTISGFASVVMSPTSAKLVVAARTLRMILPERVLGISATIQIFFGLAIFPISVSIALATFSSMSLLGLNPGFSAT